MPITDPQVVAFCNNRVRRHADILYSAWRGAKDLIAEYNANDIGSKINAAGAGELIEDGSLTDGRTRLTGGDIYNYITALQQLERFVENLSVTQADRTAVITKPYTNRHGI